MRKAAMLAVAATTLLGVSAPIAHAQRGVGDPAGVARQPAKPVIVALTGRIAEIQTGPCESTTGRALIGTHLILETGENEQFNIHLGPAAAVADTVAKLAAGQEVAVKGFRTEKMKAKHYVAQSLTIGDETFALRDEGLRPVWAGGNVGPGRGPGWGCGQGRGRGPGWGRRGPW